MARLDQIQTFVRIVESGSLSRAAERLGIAKSAVSRRLAELEGRLGVQLFRRTTRRLSLTDAGRGFYDRCTRILADVDEAEQAVSQVHGTLRGSLRVAVPLSFGLLHLGPAIVEFAANHPGVEFELDFNDRAVDLLQEGFDVAVRIAQLPDSSLIARHIAPIRMVLCASPDYLARHPEPRVPADLAMHACLVYSNAPDARLWRYRAPDGTEGSVRVNTHLLANNGDFLQRAALAGAGITMAPTFLAYRAISEGLLRPVLSTYHWPRLDAYAIYPQTRHLSQRVRAFVDFLASRFGGTPYWDAELEPNNYDLASDNT